MLNLLEKSIIKRLSEDIPLDTNPYKILAEELGIGEEELILKVEELRNKGILRRVGAVLYHREVGFNANAMVVWIVPKDRIEEVGKVVCSFSQVTHCYERPTYPNWPYNFFTMIHSKTKEECDLLIEKISKSIGIDKYEILYSTKELKKE